MALRIDEWRLRMTENVQNVLGKLSAAGDKTARKFQGLQGRMQQQMAGMERGLKGGMGGAMGRLGGQLQQLTSQFTGMLPLPGMMAGGIGAMAGPLGIALALVGAIGIGLTKGVQAAEMFGREFRQLRNLNMDKSREEIQALNDDILSLSMAKGLDPQQVSRGYYDIQSATGKTGQEVLDLVGRVGEASRALNMDYGAAINGVGKAMVAFGLGTQDLDKLLESNAKTVQMGIVNFDQLAKAQTEYAGAAASAGQKVDSANKVFAILSQHTKSPDIAGTYAKGAFTDLTKANTVKGLESIGVAVFDANDQLRQADDILRDLVPALQGMSDKRFSALKEEIGGQEGLRALLDAAKGSGQETLRVLEGFDASKFDVGKAIEDANGDLDAMKNILGNQLTAAFTMLGQHVMPIAIHIAAAFSRGVQHLVEFGTQLRMAGEWMRWVYDQSMLVRGVIQGIGVAFKLVWTGLVTVIQNTFTMLITPIKAIGEALRGNFSEAWQTIKDGGMEVLNNFGNAANEGLKNIGEGLEEVWNPSLVLPIKTKLEAPQAGAPTAADALAAGGKALNTLGGSGTDTGVKQGVQQVTGGGHQVRNVTVTIQHLVREVVVNATTVREGAQDIRRAVEEALIRAVQGSELALAND